MVDEERTLLIEQYKELCANGRNIDNKLWAFPTTALTFEAAATKFLLVDSPPADVALVVSFLLLIVFSGFLVQLIRFRAYQINTEAAIAALLERHLPELVHVQQFTGLSVPQAAADIPWFVQLVRFSSTNYVAGVMGVVLLVNVLIVIRSAAALFR